MQIDSYRELKVLDELSDNPTPTQRHLAKKLGVALGLTNLMLRRCVKKGYVQVVNVQKERLKYLLTPKGIAEKTRLTYEYLEYSLHLYRNARESLRGTLCQIAERGGKEVVFLGRGEIAEIAYLTLQELGLHLKGIFDDQTAGENFLGHPVKEMKKLRSATFDCAVIGSLNGNLEGIKEAFKEMKLPVEKIVLIKQNGPLIRSVLPGPTE